MKNILISFFYLLFSITCFSQSTVDILHYNFQIKLDDRSDTIKGSASIRLMFLQDASELQLDLSAVSDKKGMSVFYLADSLDQKKILSFTHKGEKINIRFPRKINKGETRTLIIRYQGIPSDGLIISKNKFGKRTFFSDNWPNRAHKWLPCVDDPGDKASVEFAVTAPSHYQVISNGIQVEETNLPGELKLTRYKEDIPLPTKIMVIGVAEFAVADDGLVNNCIPVTTWVFPENKAEGFSDYAMTRDILEFYTKYIGPYAFKKLANVQSKTIFGGMENASAIFYFENSVNGRQDQESLFAHEIVHQWFGNMATEKSFAHLWLSEGFATYLTHVYLESKYGTDSLAKRMQNDRKEVLEFVRLNHRPVVDSTKDFMSLLNDNSYQKGSWVLHMLRRQLGDSVFHESIRRYYQAYSGKNADSKDLQKIFEQVSGKNLDTFFRQWLHTPENPSLDIAWNYDQKKKQINIRVKQTGSNIFDLPLQVGIINTIGKMQVLDVRVNKIENTFNFPSEVKPANIMIDPNTSLLLSSTLAEKTF